MNVRVSLTALLGFVLLAAPAAAQDDVKGEVEALKQRLAELEQRLAEDEQPEMPPDDAPEAPGPDGEDGDEDGDGIDARNLWEWVTDNFHVSLNLNNVYIGADHAVARSGLLFAAAPDSTESTFLLAQFEIDIWTEFDHGVDFRVDIDTVENDDFGSVRFFDDLQVEQGYIQIDLDKLIGDIPLQFVFGRFNAPMGFEPIDAPGLWQTTRSNVARFLTPSNFTGAMVRVPTEHVDVEAYVVNGWDNNDDDLDEEKTYGGRVTLKFGDMLSIATAVSHGHESSTSLHSRHRRTVFDVVIQSQPIDMLKIAFEYNYGHENRPSDGVFTGGRHEVWQGYQLSVNVQLLDWFGITLRGDYIHDEDGFQVREPLIAPVQGTYLKSFTTALLFKIPLGNEYIPEFFFNMEWRYDRSNIKTWSTRAPFTVAEEYHRSQFAFQVFFYF